MIPHLTWFTAPHCARPVRQHKKKNSIRRRFALRRGIHPCCSGLQVQGSAISPAGMAYFHSRSTADHGIIPHFKGFCKGVLKDSRKFHKWEKLWCLRVYSPKVILGQGGKNHLKRRSFFPPSPEKDRLDQKVAVAPTPLSPWLTAPRGEHTSYEIPSTR